jgi:4-amino-4-deoxy-L-arabinose transferase-like glycosyltransferase
MRLSSLVLVLFSGAALYGLCRELGLARGRAALGAAAYLFNPLTFVLAYTFMTDGQFTALTVIATYLYVRGLNPARLDPIAITVGSAVAALAFLTRQQGALIPLAVGCYLVLAGRWRLDRASLKLTLWVAAIPAVSVLLYYLWLFNVHGTPEQQDAFVQQIVNAGWNDTRLLFGRMTHIETIYLGFFVFPLAVAVLPGIVHWRLPVRWPGIALLLGWTAVLLVGLRLFADAGRVMPYIPQFVGTHGVGPTDLFGGRPSLVDISARDTLTTLCATGVFVFILLVSRRLDDPRPTPARAGAALVAAIAIWQVIGILPPSFHFRNWIVSVDRYLLPMVPFGIALLLWASRDVPLVRPLGWLAVGAYALFSVVATRDFLVFQGATWTMARTAIESGVPLTRLDAGASWDGYHLYEYSLANGITQQTRGGPWWTNLFGPATDSTYVVASGVIRGYDPIFVREYSSWSHDEPQLMYLLRRQGVPGPP